MEKKFTEEEVKNLLISLINSVPAQSLPEFLKVLQTVVDTYGVDFDVSDQNNLWKI